MATGEITEFHEIMFSTNVELLLDQRGSLLRNAVMEKPFTGKQAQAVKQIGTQEAVEVTERNTDTPWFEHTHTSRWIFPKWFAYEAHFDEFVDGVQMMTNPMSSYAQDAADALGRKIDDRIITAFLGTAKTGDLGSTSTVYDTNMTVGTNVGGTATGLNLKKLRNAKQLFLENDVDVKNDTLFVAISPEQHDNLLGQTQAVSLDYTNKPALVNGEITSFMGFNFIVTNKLPVDGSSLRRCVAWAKSGMVLGTWKGISTRVKERADKMDIPQLLTKMSFDATRLEEKKVSEIKCTEV